MEFNVSQSRTKNEIAAYKEMIIYAVDIHRKAIKLIFARDEIFINICIRISIFICNSIFCKFYRFTDYFIYNFEVSYFFLIATGVIALSLNLFRVCILVLSNMSTNKTEQIFL